MLLAKAIPQSISLLEVVCNRGHALSISPREFEVRWPLSGHTFHFECAGTHSQMGDSHLHGDMAEEWLNSEGF